MEKFSTSQIKFLKRLNFLLAQKEKELFTRCKQLVKEYDKRLIKKGGDLDDYEIEITADYRISGSALEPRYCFTDTVSKSDFRTSEEKGKQHRDRTQSTEKFGLADGLDHSRGSFPDIGGKWCYYMHALYSHSLMKRKLIFKIYRIDFEIHITEQQFVKTVENDFFS